jgi:hypothetical protein
MNSSIASTSNIPKSEVPIPGNSLIFFFFITLGFTIVTLISIQNAKSIESIEKAKDSTLVNTIYICVIIIGSYFLNTAISKAICNSQSIQWSTILVATLLPWLVIFFSLYIVLKIFPGWITPFSNTIGYLVISILGVEKTLTDILTDDSQEPDLRKAIANIKQNKSNFINQMDIDTTNFIEFIDELAKAGIIDSAKLDSLAIMEQEKTATEEAPSIQEPRTQEPRTQEPRTQEPRTQEPSAQPTEAPTLKGGALETENTDSYKTNFHIQKLYKLLVIKNVIGKITWYTLAGVLVSSISYNFITNMSCDKTVEDIQKDIARVDAAGKEYDSKYYS